LLYSLYYQWRRFWTRFNGPRPRGRLASWLASWGAAPYVGRAYLAGYFPRGFISHTAYMRPLKVQRGTHTYLGDRVALISGGRDCGDIVLGDGVHLYGEDLLVTGRRGSIRIGRDTHVQPGVHVRAFVADVVIGEQVEIASGCAIYSYNHAMVAGAPIMEQPLTSKGPVVIGDGAWLGHGVTVLSGVNIGKGAVVAAGAVVNADVPENAIVGGVPARVLGMRPESEASAPVSAVPEE